MADLAAAKEREGYSSPYLKKHAEEDFKGQIQRVITNVNGKVDVVTFRSTAAKILQEFRNRKTSGDIEVKKMRIKNEIKQLDNNTTFYPTVEEMETLNDFSLSKFAPPTVLDFLKNLISCKNCDLLVASIAQTIIQNTRARSIMTPIQLSLAVILHRHFKSRYLIDILHKFGLCISYSEVLNYELALLINLALICMTLILIRLSILLQAM